LRHSPSADLIRAGLPALNSRTALSTSVAMI
jgi:hypothetical protein